MTMALSYKRSTSTTSGILGFRTGSNYPALGIRLIPTLKQVAMQVANPLLLPVIVYGLWTDHLHSEHITVGSHLRTIQRHTGLMDDYLRLSARVDDLVNFDGVHRELVMQHAYLTNGISHFVSSLGPATLSGLDKVKRFCSTRQRFPQNPYDDSDLRSYVEHMQVKTSAALQHRERMLARIGMYLQVASVHPPSNRQLLD
jgi:hypothetical protein